MYRYRTDWRGRLILQVSETKRAYGYQGECGPPYTDWRDATVSDISEHRQPVRPTTPDANGATSHER